jgi:hypothetical protein
MYRKMCTGRMRNTVLFYIRDVSILDFGILRGAWNQSPMGTEGQLYFHSSHITGKCVLEQTLIVNW